MDGHHLDHFRSGIGIGRQIPRVACGQFKPDTFQKTPDGRLFLIGSERFNSFPKTIKNQGVLARRFLVAGKPGLEISGLMQKGQHHLAHRFAPGHFTVLFDLGEKVLDLAGGFLADSRNCRA